jgi:hypothetical protein
MVQKIMHIRAIENLTLGLGKSKIVRPDAELFAKLSRLLGVMLQTVHYLFLRRLLLIKHPAIVFRYWW